MDDPKREATDTEVEVCEFLNDLREGGSINMYGASPVISSTFGLNHKESKRILLLWMGNFNEDNNYTKVTD
tara:strand:+ start:26875 stop:27087 length:213 start_codon:yes stop_codon:yes gene_type:complete